MIYNKATSSRMRSFLWLFQMMTVWFGLVLVQICCVRSQQQSFVPDGITASSSLHSSQPNWVRNHQNIEQQEQHQLVINDAIHFVTKAQLELMRSLQEQQQCNTTEGADNPCVLQPPEVVCESYNNGTTASMLTCNCSRFGTRDTQVDCTYNTPQCNADNTTCYVGSISQILNVTLQSRAVTTCTTFIKSFVPSVPVQSELCIRVYPFEDGNYETLLSCEVSLRSAEDIIAGNNIGGDVCNSCTICENPPSDASSGSSKNTTVNPNISFNCCNVISDIRQTCVPVSATYGVAIPQYDAVTSENQGRCTSHAVRTQTFHGMLVPMLLLYGLSSTTLLVGMLL